MTSHRFGYPATPPEGAAGAAVPQRPAIVETVEEMSAAWELWMSSWEQWLADMVTFLDSLGEQAPETPTHAQPSTQAPAALRRRLMRAAALRTHLEAQLRDRVATRRRWVPATDTGSEQPRTTLDL